MITGATSVLTASAIANRVGILEEGGEAISGRQLAGMTETELIENVDRYRVYARVSPEDKIRIVRAWQQRGDVSP
jgi:Ca2+-transporting ATPase